jgi:hypothetical protein
MGLSLIWSLVSLDYCLNICYQCKYTHHVPLCSIPYYSLSGRHLGPTGILNNTNELKYLNTFDMLGVTIEKTCDKVEYLSNHWLDLFKI